MDKRGVMVALASLLAWTAPVLARETSLPTAPLTVHITPATIREGAEAVLRVEPRDGARTATELFDIYLVRIPSGPPLLRYLWPTGVWSQTPSPYERNAFLPRFTSVTATWREEGPVGWISLLVVFPRPGADPGDRVSWVFQPVMTRIMVRPGEPTSRGDLMRFGMLVGLLTLGACIAVVARWPRRAEGPRR